MPRSVNAYNYSNSQALLLVTLRILLGWYFLYEGLAKIFNPDWSSMGYLMDSKGPFSGIFHAMASNMQAVSVVDWLNMWGLSLNGRGLMLGVPTQLSLMLGIVLLVLYYLSHPALPAVTGIGKNKGLFEYDF